MDLHGCTGQKDIVLIDGLHLGMLLFHGLKGTDDLEHVPVGAVDWFWKIRRS